VDLGFNTGRHAELAPCLCVRVNTKEEKSEASVLCVCVSTFVCVCGFVISLLTHSDNCIKVEGEPNSVSVLSEVSAI